MFFLKNNKLGDVLCVLGFMLFDLYFYEVWSFIFSKFFLGYEVGVCSFVWFLGEFLRLGFSVFDLVLVEVVVDGFEVFL